MDLNKLKTNYSNFLKDEHHSFVVTLRRQRAAELRELFARADYWTVEKFNTEAWYISSYVDLGHRKEEKPYGEDFRIRPEIFAELKTAFDAGILRYVGNSIWSAGTYFYDAGNRLSPEEKLVNIKKMLGIVTDATLSSSEKAAAINPIPYFGPATASGFTMVMHPQDYALDNAPPRAALADLGYFIAKESPEAFQKVMSELKEQLGAEDFLALDWFLFQHYLEVKNRIVPKLAKPFSDWYKDANEAQWVFDLYAEAFRHLGFDDGHHPALHLTTPKQSSSKMRINFRNWWIFSVDSAKGKAVAVNIALLDSLAPEGYDHKYGAYVNSEPSICLYRYKLDKVRPWQQELEQAFVATMQHLAESYSHFSGASTKNSHRPELVRATLDYAYRFKLLEKGLVDQKPIWWVNQGTNFEHELAHSCLCVSPTRKDGSETHVLKEFRQVSIGDTIIHYNKGSIVAYSIVQETAELGVRPYQSAATTDTSPEEVYRLTTSYVLLDIPIALDAIPLEWRLENAKKSPFNKHGGLNQDYFFAVPTELAKKLPLAFPELFGRIILKVAQGKLAKHWEKNLKENITTVGWGNLGDLNGYDSKDALRDTFTEIYGDNYNHHKATITKHVEGIWAFKNLSSGDLLIANLGTKEVLAVGVVQDNAYVFHSNREEHQHTVAVDWDTSFATEVPQQTAWQMTFSNVSTEFYRKEIFFASEAAIWLFQANPKLWDLAYYLGQAKLGDEESWLITRYVSDYKVGDTVLLWQAGSDAGLYAVAEIVSGIYEREASEFRQGETQATDSSQKEKALTLRYKQIFKAHIPRERFLTHPVLREMQVIKSPQGTNFKVSPAQWQAIQSLFKESQNMNEVVDERTRFATIVASIHDNGLKLSERILRRYHLGLQARKFVILSGVSGTGKTWLASGYAKAIGAEYKVVAVAPNWMSNEDLLGYHNPLLESKEGIDAYIDTAFSSFLRQATADYATNGNGAKDYHLILDEMNLARIEYYFANFLSAMELRMRGEKATLTLGKEEIDLPPNLYVIGTVNIDETTHVFADKVYDRAQLIELPLDGQQLRNHIEDLHYADLLMDIWKAVYEVAPFAFRVLDEIRAYVKQAEMIEVDWSEALDEQILQKVLPKLKGSDSRLQKVLAEFIALAEEHDLSLSLAKAKVMQEHYNERGFTSYF